MGFKCGIVGLPNVGKSTLFNALTNSSKAQAANFPFCTIDPNIGVVPVPDYRLDELVKISNSKKKINKIILEVKIQRKEIDKNHVEKIINLKESRFSKYCVGINCLRNSNWFDLIIDFI